jgi:hypothetical protein
MTDGIQGALIGLGGVLAGSAVSFVAQLINLRAQRRNLTDQHRADEILRARERRRDRLLDAIAGLMATTDPQSTDFNYSNMLRHVHHAQLLLDPRVSEELSLNQAISNLGLAVHEYSAVKHLDISEKDFETRRILEAQSGVVEGCRRLVWTGGAGLRVVAA